MQGPHGLSLEALSLQSQVQQLTALLAQSNANVAAAMMGENFGSSSVETGYGINYQLSHRHFLGHKRDLFTVMFMGTTTRTIRLSAT